MPDTLIGLSPRAYRLSAERRQRIEELAMDLDHFAEIYNFTQHEQWVDLAIMLIETRQV